MFGLRQRTQSLTGVQRAWLVAIGIWATVVSGATFYGYAPAGLSYDQRQRWLAEVQATIQFTERITYRNGLIEEKPFALDISWNDVSRASDALYTCFTHPQRDETICDYTILSLYDAAWPKVTVHGGRCIDEASCTSGDDWTSEILPDRDVARERIRAITKSHERRAYWTSLFGDLLAALGYIVAPIVGVFALVAVARWVLAGFRHKND